MVAWKVILEAIVNSMLPEMPNKKNNVYGRLDKLQQEKIISNTDELKSLWKARRSIHLHLKKTDDPIEFNDENYIL